MWARREEKSPEIRKKEGTISPRNKAESVAALGASSCDPLVGVSAHSRAERKAGGPAWDVRSHASHSYLFIFKREAFKMLLSWWKYLRGRKKESTIPTEIKRKKLILYFYFYFLGGPEFYVCKSNNKKSTEKCIHRSVLPSPWGVQIWIMCML